MIVLSNISKDLKRSKKIAINFKRFSRNFICRGFKIFPSIFSYVEVIFNLRSISKYLNQSEH